MNLTCDKCSSVGLGFFSLNIQPHEYLEGKKDADIWIIGLNPKGSIGNIEQITLSDFENFDPDCHSYFHDFRKVSPRLYSNWKSEKSRIAHTDLVKCFSPSFPPKVVVENKEKVVRVETIVQNCKTHLLKQINSSRPKVIICNGSEVCREMLRLFTPQTTEEWQTLTSYKTTVTFENNLKHSFWVVLSGFIGRIDDRNKRRLGKEIERILEDEKMEL